MRHCVLSILASLALTGAASAQSTAFTFQGQLKDGDALAAGLHDFRFTLFDAAAGGVAVAAPNCSDNLLVSEGLFTATLDFGQFITTAPRFLQVEVRADTGLGCGNLSGFIALEPRQPVTAAPIATHAKSAFSLAAADGSPASAVIVDNAGRVGIGTATPASTLHALADAAALRLQDDSDPASFLLLEALQPGQMRLNNTASAGISLIDINPMPLVGTANAHVRFFRETNTTGIKSVIFHSGNNTNATSAVIGVGGSSSVFQLDGGNVGIGAPSPSKPLHIARDLDPVIVIQDTGPASTQAGYVAFWNNAGAETGWAGFGSPGSPHFTVSNARTGGDILLTPASGKVRLGASGQFFAPGGEENLRIIRGTISAAGLVWAGSGWTVTRPSTGVCVVTYNTPFPSSVDPTVVVSSSSFSVAGSAMLGSQANTGFTVRTFDQNNAPINSAVSFTALGAR